jgi:hypothetical protein
MKFHNPFENEPSASLAISLIIVLPVVTYVLVSLAVYYPFVVIPIVLLAAVIRVVYAIIKGE